MPPTPLPWRWRASSSCCPTTTRRCTPGSGSDGWIEYRSHRTHAGAPAANFGGSYRPTDHVYLSRPGDLDNWLTERYALYTVDAKGRPYIGEIHHVAWPLQPADADLRAADLVGASAALALPAAPPLLHFARRIDMAAWALRRVRG